MDYGVVATGIAINVTIIMLANTLKYPNLRIASIFQRSMSPDILALACYSLL